MESIIGFFVKNRLAVGVFVFILALFGMLSYIRLPREAAPDLKIPVVLVTVPYPGVSPSDIETLVVRELETELKDLKDVKVMRSTAAEGAGIVTIEFLPSVDIDEALRKVREKVDQAKPEMPADALEPVVKEVSFEDFPILVVNLSANYSLIRLKQVAEDLQDELEEIPGVLEVKLAGGLEREIRVLADPARLAYHSISINELVNAIRGENINLPGGAVESGGASFLVRVPGEYRSSTEIENVVIKSRGSPGQAQVSLRVGDVARVIDSYKERDTLSRLNRTESVSLNITKRGGENLIFIADEVKRIVSEEIEVLPPGTRVTFLQDQSQFIREMVSDLENNILTGLLLVIAVLPFFLTIRSSLIVATAIPLSMLMSMVIIDSFGITLNMIVLFSLILALGMLVDNSIVVVENVYRVMSQGRSRISAAIEGTRQVAWPVIASTATTVAAFFPLLFWPGIMGQFMGYLPRTLIITLCSSLFVALFINPVMCAAFLQLDNKHQAMDDTEPETWMYRKYRTFLFAALRRWYLTLPAVLGVLVGTIGIFGSMNLGVEFFPAGTPDNATLEIRAADGNRLEATDEMVMRIEDLLDGNPHIKNFVTSVGTGGGGRSGGAAAHLAQISIDFLDAEQRKESSLDTLEKIRNTVERVPGAKFEVRKQETGPPSGAPVSVELKGDNWETLGEMTRQVTEAIRNVEGLVDLKDDYNLGRPEIQVRVDREKAKLAGTSTFQVAQAVRSAINGTDATKLRDGSEEYDVVVRFEDRYRLSLEDLENLLVTGKEGRQIPLREVAALVTTAGAGSIRHKDRDRVITLSANNDGRLPDEIRKDVEAILSQMSFPPGYSWRMAGQNEEQEAAQAFLGKAFLIAALCIVLILVLQFNSLLTPAIIMTSVLLSTIGALWGLIAFQMPFGVIMTGLGIISLAGVAVNNAIVLIDFIQKRMTELPDRREAIVSAGVVRLRPVLLTAITTVLGLVPMVFGISINFLEGTVTIGGRSGEIWKSMAVAVSFGLIFTTFLTLVVVPVLFERFDIFGNKISSLWVRIFGNPEEAAQNDSLSKDSTNEASAPSSGDNNAQ